MALIVIDLRKALGGLADKVRLEQADVTDAEVVARLCAAAAEPTGRLDILTQLVGGFATTGTSTASGGGSCGWSRRRS